MSIIAIIPALDQNNYSPLGDLHNWGDTTLLEWKVSQLNLVDKIDKIVSSAFNPDDRNTGAIMVLMSMSEVIRECATANAFLG